MDLCEAIPGNFGGSDAGNSVSQLQELVQGCTSFWPHTKILTWSFEQRMEADASLQFRASVSFVFREVPHHFAGDWLTSKKKAQRDTAERVRCYLLHHFELHGGSDATLRAGTDADGISEAALQELRAVCSTPGQPPASRELVPANSVAGPDSLHWEFAEWRPTGEVGEGGGLQGHVRATVTFLVYSVPHHFAGSWRESSEAAKRDTAQRALWYLGAGAEAFAVDERLALRKASAPPPPLGTAGAEVGGPTSSPQTVMDDKTILMQVQNTLQKTFAKETLPGERVWHWSYEPDSRDPQRFRARVEVPYLGLRFVGDWCRGKKLAQRSACLVVKRHLDQMSTPG